MDWKLMFWIFAFANLSLAVGLAIHGRALARRGDLAGHRRSMKGASALIVLFLVAYLVKVPVLGKEDLATWPVRDIALLRIHETCIAFMLLGGGAAHLLARRFRHRTDTDGSGTRFHRLVGRAAILGAGAGLLTGGLLLAAMVGHARGPALAEAAPPNVPAAEP